MKRDCHLFFETLGTELKIDLQKEGETKSPQPILAQAEPIQQSAIPSQPLPVEHMMPTEQATAIEPIVVEPIAIAVSIGNGADNTEFHQPVAGQDELTNCPECSMGLVKKEGCLSCPECGWGLCK